MALLCAWNRSSIVFDVSLYTCYNCSHPFLIDDERAFGYVRLITGDEMSKRSKFALITWIGKNVKPLQKARVSTDKAFVKDVLRVSWNFFFILRFFFLFKGWMEGGLLGVILIVLFFTSQVFAIEVSVDDVSDITENKVREAVIKAGGANYGTGN